MVNFWLIESRCCPFAPHTVSPYKYWQVLVELLQWLPWPRQDAGPGQIFWHGINKVSAPPQEKKKKNAREGESVQNQFYTLCT